MKTVIISKSLVSALRVKNFLKEEFLDCDFKIYQSEDDLLSSISILAIIFPLISSDSILMRRIS